jgi:hypothetical protein
MTDLNPNTSGERGGFTSSRTFSRSPAEYAPSTELCYTPSLQSLRSDPNSSNAITILSGMNCTLVASQSGWVGVPSLPWNRNTATALILQSFSAASSATRSATAATTHPAAQRPRSERRSRRQQSADAQSREGGASIIALLLR